MDSEERGDDAKKYSHKSSMASESGRHLRTDRSLEIASYRHQAESQFTVRPTVLCIKGDAQRGLLSYPVQSELEAPVKK